jgi:8-oxo-dGTP diphosphatase
MEYMHLFTADRFDGELVSECNEGELAWIPKNQISSLSLWEGDRIFLKLLTEDIPYFYLKLEYQGDTLICATLNGTVIHKG